MSIDWNTFTPWSALASGVLIGLAAAMFALLNGIDWDIAGFCPGPGLVALGISETKAMVFAAAMLVGMVVFELLERRKHPAALRIKFEVAP